MTDGLLTVFLRAAALFCAAVVGLLLSQTLSALLGRTVAFWEGGEAGLPVGVGGTALLFGAIPSYVLAAGLMRRLSGMTQLDTRYAAGVGLVQGACFLDVLLLVAVLVQHTASSFRVPPSLPPRLQVIYIFVNFAVAIVVSCVISAVVVAIVLRVRRRVRGEGN